MLLCRLSGIPVDERGDFLPGSIGDVLLTVIGAEYVCHQITLERFLGILIRILTSCRLVINTQEIGFLNEQRSETFHRFP